MIASCDVLHTLTFKSADLKVIRIHIHDYVFIFVCVFIFLISPQVLLSLSVLTKFELQKDFPAL